MTELSLFSLRDAQAFERLRAVTRRGLQWRIDRTPDFVLLRIYRPPRETDADKALVSVIGADLLQLVEKAEAKLEEEQTHG